MGFDNGIHQLIPDAGLAPPIEAVISRRIGAVTLWQITPRRTRSQHPENAVQYGPVIFTARPRPTGRQDWFDDTPLKIADIVVDFPEFSGELSVLPGH